MSDQISNRIIAIDGPAGSGKSSTAKGVAQKLQFKYLDTGAMYRAVTLYCLLNEVPLQDSISVHCAVLQLISETTNNALLDSASSDVNTGLQIGTAVDEQKVMIAGVDVTAQIRTAEVSSNVKYISGNPDARALIVILQQKITEELMGEGLVLEGRDVTDVIAPNASVKVLMTASAEVRARRRAQQLGSDSSAEVEKEVLQKIVQRDEADSKTTNFQVEDLTTEEKRGIHILDTSELNLEQSINAVVDFYNTANNSGSEKDGVNDD
jgi:cytidylate kinase